MIDGRGDGKGGEEVKKLLDGQKLRSRGVMSKGLEKFQPTGIQDPLASQWGVLHIVCMEFSESLPRECRQSIASVEDLNQRFEKF